MDIILINVGRLIMNIKNYIKDIKNKVDKINKYVSNPINHKDINNPFASTLPKTYVWIEDEKED